MTQPPADSDNDLSEKPTDQMTDEELKAARMRVLDELVRLSQELDMYDEPFVSFSPLVKP
ncbi:hypothetical protein [Nitrospira defluvii]|uniref:Uncharacterized protein n=1 Tax=Nitrospira defluvii TaxID=330214 RepID=A0ABM8RT29_9BACT|nr:hypothetical protein [Nitrospira defluvii]CAE6770286.1 hypothetical protein NSPZN2_40249 [Nitrospira defluvii]